MVANNVVVLLLSFVIVHVSAMPQQSPKDCPKFCPFDFKQVCGSDGNTYNNACLLRAKACTAKKSISVLSDGPCKTSARTGENDDEDDVGGQSAQDADLALAAEKGCAIGCPKILRPVCGSDGQLYDNECILKQTDCIRRSKDGSESRANVVVKPMSFCESERTSSLPPSVATGSSGSGLSITTLEEDCQFDCSDESDPVCGSNGQMFGSKCLLNQFVCVHNMPDLVIEASLEKCSQALQEKTTARGATAGAAVDAAAGATAGAAVDAVKSCRLVKCTRIRKPVCASDGKSYINECLMRVQACKDDSELAVVSRGTCDDPLRPSVASDASTQGGGESLNDPDRDAALILVQRSGGETILQKREAQYQSQECPSICTQDFTPVCGSDGQTYSNPCQLEVAACQSPKENLVVEKMGPCCPSICPLDYSPVCGSDGRTYSNLCGLKVEACQSPKENLVVEKSGPCDVDEYDQFQK